MWLALTLGSRRNELNLKWGRGTISESSRNLPIIHTLNYIWNKVKIVCLGFNSVVNFIKLILLSKMKTPLS